MKLFSSPYFLLLQTQSHELGVFDEHWQNSRVLKDGSSEQPNLPTPLLDEKAPIDILWEISAMKETSFLQWQGTGTWTLQLIFVHLSETHFLALAKKKTFCWPYVLCSRINGKLLLEKCSMASLILKCLTSTVSEDINWIAYILSAFQYCS